MKHGAREPFFGVKIEDLKKIQKRIKKDYQLALDLYATGISDAMYLAGLIAVGSYVRPLTALAIQTGEAVGKVSVDMGDTACKVPYAPDYIKKVQQRGSLGKKRKTAWC